MTNEEFNEVIEEIDNDIPFYDDYDAHCCSAEADENGVCQFCGAVVYGSWAYIELYGGE